MKKGMVRKKESNPKREGQPQPLDQCPSQEKGIEVDESGPLDFLPGVNSESSCTIF